MEHVPQLNPAQLEFQQLREWVRRQYPEHVVRDSHVSMALSAIAHRLIKFGPDETLNELDSVDLLRLLNFVNGPMAGWILSTAFTRAILDDRREIIDHFGNLRYLIPSELVWFHRLITTLMAAQEKPQAAFELVGKLEGEEKSMARLVMGRIYPDTVKVGWLEECPPVPRLQAKLAHIVASNSHYRHFAENWIRERPDVRNESYAA